MHPDVSMPLSPSRANAYAAFRVTHNAGSRWRFGLMLVGVMGLYLAGYSRAGLLHLEWPRTLAFDYPQVFVYLLAVGVLGLLLAPLGKPWRWIGAAVDNAWLLALLVGGALMATVDLSPQNLAGFVIICFPAAVLHSAQQRYLVALYGIALICAFVGIVHSTAAPETTTFLFLLTLVIICFTSLYVALSTEATRQRDFLTGFELEAANAALLEANRQLEANNTAMQQHAAELERLNTTLAVRSEELERANRSLNQLAMTDPLTGVANRRDFFETLDREFPRAVRYGSDLAVAVIDLDDFGRMNKLHGVLAGDEVLREFAACLRGTVREVDLVARYGGEEFVVLMPNSDAQAGRQLMERVRGDVANRAFSSRRLPLTFSAGVAALGESDTDPVMLLHRADEAMREAKEAGKNRVVAV